MARNGEIRVDNFCIGMSIEVTYITPDAGRPTLDLKDDYGNIILHVNPRWDQGTFVLNTCQGNWGPEELPSGFDFSTGVPITIRVEASHQCLTIFVNGQCLHMYNHRMPITSLKTVAWHWSPDHQTSKHARLINLSVFY